MCQFFLKRRRGCRHGVKCRNIHDEDLRAQNQPEQRKRAEHKRSRAVLLNDEERPRIVDGMRRPRPQTCLLRTQPTHEFSDVLSG